MVVAVAMAAELRSDHHHRQTKEGGGGGEEEVLFLKCTGSEFDDGFG